MTLMTSILIVTSAALAATLALALYALWRH
jgi:hypothetical protein